MEAGFLCCPATGNGNHGSFLESLQNVCVFVRTCVRPGVPLQLVAAREALPAVNPVADEGPLPRVQPDVSSEQRRFPERLLTAGNVTDVSPFAHLAGPAEETHRKHICSEKSHFKLNGG